METAAESVTLGSQHHRAGRLEEAERIYRQVLRDEPDHVDALQLLGVLRSQCGDPRESVNLIERAIALRPSVGHLHYNLGFALESAGQRESAIASYRRAAELSPDFAMAHLSLGGALQCAGLLSQAAAAFQRALELDPDLAEALQSLVTVLCEEERWDEAAKALERAAGRAPDRPELQLALADVLTRQRRFDPALAHYREALRIAPEWAEAHCNHGAALSDAGRLAEAEQALRKAAQLNARLPFAHYNLGLVLTEQGRLEEAGDCYRRTLALTPDDARAHSNLGLVLQYQGSLKEAVTCFRRALDLNPSLTEATQNLSFLSLMTGGFEKGWEQRHWLNRRVFRPRRFHQPAWKGESIEGKTILLHWERGLGDFIQFIRYAARVRERGAHIIVLCDAPLLPLLSRCDGIDLVVADEAALPSFDVHSTLVDLPLIFETNHSNIPAAVPYLHADAQEVERWRREWSAIPELKAGIAWHGNPRNPINASRSIPLDCFEPLARVPGVRLFSLQKGAGVEQLAALKGRFPVTELGSAIDSLCGTSAVVANLDLVITCDSSMAHLAGALGRPVWVALCSAPDWRWYAHRADSPWYPTMRLFRQNRPEAWRPVFDRMANDLSAEVRRP